jgi:hypothetical protein
MPNFQFRNILILWGMLNLCGTAIAANTHQMPKTQMPENCVAASDFEREELLLKKAPSVFITAFECPVGAENQGKYMAYQLEWSALDKSYLYVPYRKNDNSAIVGIMTSRPGYDVFVINEGHERGGEAIIIWRVKQGHYFARKIAYEGMDEGGLDTTLKDGILTLTYRYIDSKKRPRTYGKPLRFRLDHKNGIQPLQK